MRLPEIIVLLGKLRTLANGAPDWCFLFSLSTPYPAPFDSLHFLPSFRVSICAFASETFARPKKTPALQANKIQQSFDLGRYATLYAMGLKLFTRSSRNIKAPRYRRRLFSIIFLQIFIRLNRVRNQNRKTVWANPLKVRKAVTYPLVF